MNGMMIGAASFLSGFVFLSFEILWVRVFSFASKSSPLVFGNLLGIYLLGIAASSLVSRRWMAASRERLGRVLSAGFTLSAVSCYLVIPGTAWFSTLSYTGWKWGAGLVLFATFSFGGLFPLLVRAALTDEGEAGRLSGWLYAANIAGSTTGALTTGYVLLDKVSAGTISTLMALACLIPALGFSMDYQRKARFFSAVVPMAVACAICLTTLPLHSHLYEKLKYKPRSRLLPPFAKVIENRNGVVAVSHDGKVFGDGAYDGVLDYGLVRPRNPEIGTAFLQFLYRPGAREILTIGLGSGAWAQVLANGPEVDNVTAVEINPAYLDVVKGSLRMAGLLDNATFHPVIDDGRRWLRRNPGRRFDLIVMNTTFHWRNHATALLSKEFLELVTSHLSPGGMICINGTGSPEVSRTVAEGFAHVRKHGIYLLASDAPLVPGRKRYRAILSRFAINNRMLFNLNQARDRRVLERMVNKHEGQDRERVLDLASTHAIVTDDNMVTEFGHR